MKMTSKPKSKPQSQPKLSLAIATYNEEKNISRCLKSVHAWVDEIILVDGQSADKTVNLAQKFSKVKIISTTNKPIFHLNKQIAIDACTKDWILQLDADEEIPAALQKEILETISSPQAVSGYWIPRRNLFLGTWLKKSGQYPDPVIRLFKRGQGSLPCLSVHEQIDIKGDIGTLKNPMLHYSSPSFTRYLARWNRYNTLFAKELMDQNFPLNFRGFLISVFRAKLAFFVRFIRCKGFQDGFPGFVFAFFSGLDHITAFIKYWELNKQKRKTNLDQDWE